MAIVGATGSIGSQALQVAGAHPEAIAAVALAAGGRWRELCAAAVRCGAEVVALEDPLAAGRAAAELSGTGIRVLAGPEGVEAVAAWPSAEVVLAAPAGVAGLRPVVAALRAGKDVALANKESLVAGGRVVTREARARGGRLLPVDGEHCALFQCLQGRPAAEVARLWLTASGGPFRTWTPAAIEAATPAQALRHPTWRMGPRITVDSATLMNKGLEVIEARWLFDVPAEAIGVAVHPQSLVHALVQFVDGTFLAQCAWADMRLPIAFALCYPHRLALPEVPLLDPTRLGRLEFEPPDPERFPCLGLAFAAARAGGVAPAVLNAADEVAVARFLGGDIGLGDIPRLLSDVLGRAGGGDDASVEGVLAADAQARRAASAWRRRGGAAVRAPVAAAGCGTSGEGGANP